MSQHLTRRRRRRSSCQPEMNRTPAAPRKEKAPAWQDWGLADRRRGVGGAGCTFHPVSSSRWWLCRWCLLIQPPRIAALLKFHDRVVGNSVSLPPDAACIPSEVLATRYETRRCTDQREARKSFSKSPLCFDSPITAVNQHHHDNHRAVNDLSR